MQTLGMSVGLQHRLQPTRRRWCEDEMGWAVGTWDTSVRQTVRAQYGMVSLLFQAWPSCGGC